MSFTETQLIHRLSPSTTTAYILSQDAEVEDKGLIMKIDTKLRDSMTPMTMTTGANVKTPVSTGLCGQMYSSSLSRWVFRAASCLQAAHFVFVGFTNNVNQKIQKKAIQVLPIFLYMSLLVLAIQSIAVIVLLSQSSLPLAGWFLLGCITTLGGIYYSTAVISDPGNLASSQVPAKKFSSL